MSMRSEQCRKVCRILDDVLANRPTERDALIVAVTTAFDELKKRKTGHWIDAEWVRINTGEKRKGRRCSACGSGFFRYDVSVNTVSDIPNYCPNCGSYNGGENEV